MALAVVTAAALAPALAHASHPNALWRVVHELCVPAKRMVGVSTPCTDVDLKRGVAVVPDLKRPAHLLLVPLVRVVGIESVALQDPKGPNYWQAAWDARRFLAQRTGLALQREDVGLAVNSIYGRSQDQLHIHIACVRPDMRAALAAAAPGFSAERWTPWPGLPDRDYRVRLIRGETPPDGADPFRLLAASDPRAAAKMGKWTLALLGARLPDGSPGFYLLADRSNLAREDSAHGEELLDHSCKGAPPEPAGPSRAPLER